MEKVWYLLSKITNHPIPWKTFDWGEASINRGPLGNEVLYLSTTFEGFLFCSAKISWKYYQLSVSDILLLFEGSAMRSGGQLKRKSNYSLRQIIFEIYMSTVHRIDCLPLLLLSFIFWQYILLGSDGFWGRCGCGQLIARWFSFFPFSSDISYGDLLECTKGFNFQTSFFQPGKLHFFQFTF